MEEILLEIAKQAPAIAILLVWVYSEKSAHNDTKQFMSSQLTNCQAVLAKALERHIDAEQVTKK